MQDDDPSDATSTLAHLTMAGSASANATVETWLSNLKSSNLETRNDDPNYWTSKPGSLQAEATIESLAFGTGQSLYTNTLLPAIAKAEYEVVLVTCFWAPSATLDALNDTLVSLSAKAVAKGTKIRVRICLSSFGLWAKLLHSPSLEGQKYGPETWKQKFGLPDPDELKGLEMEVKSVFVLPFSVMHPKFVIIDRRRAFLPSCNVSWERWFEGCIGMRGEIVERFLEFYSKFWERSEGKEGSVGEIEDGESGLGNELGHGKNPEKFWWSISPSQRQVTSMFLPSPHHRNPRFSLFPWKPCPPPPMTPLNAFLLAAFANARESIYIQTPNLTAPPVLSALLEALKKGIDITIVTSEKLMILEQLVTAGTTTKRCVNALIKKHKSLLDKHKQQSLDSASVEVSAGDRPGPLRIFFFQSDPKADSTVEPTQSHLKFIDIDSIWTIFGSGNMDRASWYTSQELGLAIRSDTAVERTKGQSSDVRELLNPLLETRRRCYYDGKR